MPNKIPQYSWNVTIGSFEANRIIFGKCHTFCFDRGTTKCSLNWGDTGYINIDLGAIL